MERSFLVSWLYRNFSICLHTTGCHRLFLNPKTKTRPIRLHHGQKCHPKGLSAGLQLGRQSDLRHFQVINHSPRNHINNTFLRHNHLPLYLSQLKLGEYHPLCQPYQTMDSHPRRLLVLSHRTTTKTHTVSRWTRLRRASLFPTTSKTRTQKPLLPRSLHAQMLRTVTSDMGETLTQSTALLSRLGATILGLDLEG